MKRFKSRGRRDDCVSCFIAVIGQGCWPDTARPHGARYSAHCAPTLRLVPPPKREPYLIPRLPRLTKSAGVEVNLEVVANERNTRKLTVRKTPYYSHSSYCILYFCQNATQPSSDTGRFLRSTRSPASRKRHRASGHAPRFFENQHSPVAVSGRYLYTGRMPRLYHTKSRTGCLRCRQRRVKVSLTRVSLSPNRMLTNQPQCDEARPVCVRNNNLSSFLDDANFHLGWLQPPQG